MPKTHLNGDPGDVITVPEMRELYDRLMNGVRGIHSDMGSRPALLETRILFRGALVCRVIPHPEIFRVLVGGEPMWETRIRDAAGCADTMNRIIGRFLDLYTSGEHV